MREMVIASVGGATGHVDAYQVAFILPEILNHVVASGFLSITFIPIFTRYLAAGDKEGGWRVFSLVMTVFGTFLALMIVGAEVFAADLVRLLAPGLSDPALLAAATAMTRIILPAQFFFFTGGLFMAVQFATERFAIAALAPPGLQPGHHLRRPASGQPPGDDRVFLGGFGGGFRREFCFAMVRCQAGRASLPAAVEAQ